MTDDLGVEYGFEPAVSATGAADSSTSTDSTTTDAPANSSAGTRIAHGWSTTSRNRCATSGVIDGWST